MMRYSIRLQILGWLLVLVPTGIGAVRMLQLSRFEQERLQQRLREADLSRASALAGELRLAASDMREGVADALAAVSPADWETELPRWADRDARLGQAFVWAPPDQLLWPPEGASQTQAARAFRHRYRALFEGRQAWETAPDDDVPPPAAAPSALRLAGRGLQPAGRPTPPAAPVRWIHWFDDNRLHLLAWRRDPATERIAGVELELMSLLARLVPAFLDAPTPERMVVQLRDAAGRVLHHHGGTEDTARTQPDQRLSLEPELPSWELAVFLPHDRQPDRALTLAMRLSVGVLAGAVLAGGVLLTREATRERREARRKIGFVSNVSHELKTPLTSIRLYAELLAENRVPAGQQRRYFDIMLSECGRLSRLIGNVLDFGRLEQGRRRFRAAVLDLEPFLKTCLDAYRPQLEAAGMRVECALPPDCRVKADPDALEQVVSNLLDNAIKYAAAGGEIRFVAERCGAELALRALDRGPGVSAARRRRLFSAFQGGDAHLSAAQHGAGLGLNIVKGLVEGMGGRVAYRPQPGGGAEFEIRLPAILNMEQRR